MMKETNKMKKTVIDYNTDLTGLINIDGKKLPINNAIKGETLEVNYTNNKKTLKVDKIIEPSIYRITPPCNIYNRCGGCKLLHIKYEHQLELKTNLVKELFKDFKVKINDTLGMTNPNHYRNKNQIVFGFDDKRRIVSGFYEEFTHKIVNFETCYVQDEISDNIVKTIKDLFLKMHIMPYDETKRRGLIRHVMIKRSKALNETMVIIVTSQDVFPGRQNFIKALLSKHKDITTIIQNINPKATTHVLGDKEIVLFGKGYINDILCKCKFKISSKSFYQINPIQTKVLYEKAIELANLQKDEIVLDAYSGVGTIGIVLASSVSKVISVELEKSSHIDAINNAKINNIKNIHFYNDDATRFIINLANKKEHIDVVIMDPPRKGSDEGFLKAVLKLKPKKIIYISCNPQTQVIDLKYLINDYKITYVQPVDMFPQTHHVETVVCLEKK